MKCEYLLRDPVQLSCGHRVCKHCADELIDNAETTPLCPECGDEITEEDGAKVSKKSGSLVTYTDTVLQADQNVQV